MPSQRWQYDADARRYRDTRNGRFLARSTIKGLRDRLLDRGDAQLRALARRVADPDGDVREFERDARQVLKKLYGTQYMLGRGGANAMTQRDWGIIGHVVRDQYAWLNRFAFDLAAGKLSAAQIEARASYYAGSSVQAAERGIAEAHGIQLTRHPGDGSTDCKSNCRCHLEIGDGGSTWEVRWILDDGAAHCLTCPSLAAAWGPLVLPKRA